MAVNSRLEEYASVLRIRTSGYRRNAAITGALFSFAFLAFVASGLVGGTWGRPQALELAGVAVLGSAFLTAWVRLEIARALAQVVTALRA